MTQLGRFLPLVAVPCLLGCGGSAFRYASVSGQVTYDDGSRLPLEQVVLNFHSLEKQSHGPKVPPPGAVVLDAKTGRFRTGATKQSGGLVVGRHRVTLHLPGRKPLPQHIAAAEYADPSLTPLYVDTNDQPFRISVKRPHQATGHGSPSK